MLFAAAAPLDIGFVDLLVGVLAFGDCGFGQFLAVILRHRYDQLVHCLMICGVVHRFT